MIFDFEIKEHSMYSETTITKQGDYQGPSTLDYEINGENITLNSSNPTHIILMDIIDGSSWHTPDDEKIMMEEINSEFGIFKKIYNLDTPSEGYTLEGLVLLENGDVDIQLDTPTISVEERTQKLNDLLFFYDSQQAGSVVPSRKQLFVDAINKITWILNSLPSEIDIRDIIIPEIEGEN